MFSEQLLEGKKILVTGGGTGIGKSLATRFLELGAEIVICGRREEVLKGTVGEWVKAGATVPAMVSSTTRRVTLSRVPRRSLLRRSMRSSTSFFTEAPTVPWPPASDGSRATTRVRSSRS